MNIQKIAKVILIGLTLTTAAVLSYTIYLFLGVNWAIRAIDVSICEVSVQQLNTTDSTVHANVTTVLTVRNPSRFCFAVSFVRETLFFDGKLIGGAEGRCRSFITPLPIEPFSDKNVTLLFSEVVLPAEPSADSSWQASVFIKLVTPLPDVVRLHFEKQYP